MVRKQIKVMHVVDALGVGGMERMLINLVNQMDEARFEHLVCCVSRPGEAAGQLSPAVRCFNMGKGAERDLLMPRKIARLIHTERPDIVHTRAWSGIDGVIAQQLARLSGHRAKLVHSEHGRSLQNMHAEPLKSRIARRVAYELADVAFAVSSELRDHFCRETGFSKDRMRVLPNGIEAARFDEADACGVRQELGITADEFVIGMVARLDPPKDLLTLARAFAQMTVQPREHGLRLLLIGDGSERKKVESFIAEQKLDRVILAGTRQDVPRVLKAMNVFALSSLSEGLSGAILEAMCAGLPVVATSVGANPELVSEGETGFLVKAGDADTMAKRFEQLLSDPQLAQQMGQAGRCKAGQQYSLTAMVQRYQALYESLVAV